MNWLEKHSLVCLAMCVHARQNMLLGVQGLLRAGGQPQAPLACSTLWCLTRDRRRTDNFCPGMDARYCGTLGKGFVASWKRIVALSTLFVLKETKKNSSYFGGIAVTLKLLTARTFFSYFS